MILIRPYQPEDCATLANLFYNTVHTINAADYSTEQLQVWATGTVDLSAWNAAFLAHITNIAEIGTTIVGFADRTHSGYLDRLFVHHQYQRMGIATALCDALEADFSGIITTQASITAKPFFEQRGYRVLCSQQVERQGVFLTNYRMEKRILPEKSPQNGVTLS